jgi:hypothetical protein
MENTKIMESTFTDAANVLTMEQIHILDPDNGKTILRKNGGNKPTKKKKSKKNAE